ncbi:hypothetical protein FEM48_Zijuj11G0052000 [Ziziphus jujuba var. spinosa]|uniref:Myeloid leukemia factor 1 n=1 Tax=Ziziphus jujuba var. spinosa TaxID=714518 RepID=A0A978UH12_ZIZJJ|nr:hypothetical protein FEM48_Zijuj11G0052000 [Ziziphus jujuba var. spinosa]
MQGGRGGRNPFSEFGDPFAGFGGFGGFGGRGSLMSNFFGGRGDPFDDPFFTRPFGGMFDSSFFGPSIGMNPFAEMHPSGFLEQQPPEPKRSRGPIIEELNSDDENEDYKEKRENPKKHARTSNEPYIEVPDDEIEGRKNEQLLYRNEYNRSSDMQSQPQTRSFTFQSSTISYGGANGTYYTSSNTRRTGSDGLTFEESKEADTATRQASHRVSRGLRNKVAYLDVNSGSDNSDSAGHSVTRKLDSDGKVDTRQTLHNLNEDELGHFEETWKGNAQKYLPGWTGNLGGYENAGGSSSGYNPQAQGGWALPSTEQSQHSGRVIANTRDRAGSSRTQHQSRMKSDVN